MHSLCHIVQKTEQALLLQKAKLKVLQVNNLLFALYIINRIVLAA